MQKKLNFSSFSETHALEKFNLFNESSIIKYRKNVLYYAYSIDTMIKLGAPKNILFVIHFRVFCF